MEQGWTTPSNSPVMAFIVLTSSTQIIPLQPEPRGQPRTQGPKAGATCCTYPLGALSIGFLGLLGVTLSPALPHIPPDTHCPAEPTQLLLSSHHTKPPARQKNPARTSPCLQLQPHHQDFQESTSLSHPLEQNRGKNLIFSPKVPLYNSLLFLHLSVLPKS